VTRIDFYVLAPQASGNRYALACRLAEKAWRQNHRVLIQVDSRETAQHVNRLLWTFREGSFIPHGLLGEADPALNPVLISDGQDPGDEHDVLINLAREVPGFFSRFARVAECLDAEAEVRAAGRERFRYYRDRGYPLHTVDIS
jgi:DNA polymerase-3 subunit chi